MNSGPGWKNAGDGWVLFRPNRKSATYRITEDEHRQIRQATNAEVMVAVFSIIPVAAAWLFWWVGRLDLGRALAALSVYVLANSWLSWRRFRAVNVITLRAERSPIDVEFETTGAIAVKVAADTKAALKAEFRFRMAVAGYAFVAYGVASLVLAGFKVTRIVVLPVLGSPISYLTVAMGVGILLSVRPWRGRRT